MKTSQTFQWLLRLIIAAMLFTVLITNSVSASSLHESDNKPVAVSTPDPSYLVLGGTSWLNGHGVDVFYTPNQYDPHPRGPNDTILYECVELVTRLYNTSGMNYGKWPISHAFQMWDMRDSNGNRPKGFEDLQYFSNNGTTPPRPGDIVVWPSSFNGGDGHVAIVNKVAGKWVEIVQQNTWWADSNGNPQKHPRESLNLSWDSQGRYTLKASWTTSIPLGWIRSPRMDKRLTLQTSIINVSNTNGQVSWNQDSETVYIYLSSQKVRDVKDSKIGKKEIVADLFKDSRNILGYITDSYARCETDFVVGKIRNDDRFNPNKGITGITYTIKYTGGNIWIRPWGGTANGQWIPFSGLVCP